MSEQTGRISADGAYWWDGGQWVSALSPDGRWRWDGSRWVVNDASIARPGAAALEPSADTRRLQVVIVGLAGLSLVIGIVGLLTWVPAELDVASAQAAANSTLDPATAAMFFQWGVYGGVVVTFGWSVVVIAGSLLRWRWIYYVLMALYTIGLYTLIANVGYLFNGPPSWLPAILPPLNVGMTLALFGVAVWMFVLWRRYRTAWAMRAVPT